MALYGVGSYSNGSQVVVISSNDSAGSSQFTQSFQQELERSGKRVASQGAGGKAILNALTDGNIKDLRDSGLLAKVKSIEHYALNTSCRETSSLNGAFVCEANVKRGVISAANDSIRVNNFSDSAVGVTIDQSINEFVKKIIPMLKG